MHTIKPLSVKEIRSLDHAAIHEYGIPSIVLMENAGVRTVDFIQEWYKKCILKQHITIVCGRGNNGGDGLVIARHLLNKGYRVNVFLIADEGSLKGDPLINFNILAKMETEVRFTGLGEVPDTFADSLSHADFLIDAIFGIGLDRKVDEPYANYVKLMNASGRPILAVDSPSGLNCDTGEVMGICVKAVNTVTMIAPKKGFYCGEGPSHTGNVHVVDISIPRELLREDM